MPNTTPTTQVPPGAISVGEWHEQGPGEHWRRFERTHRQVHTPWGVVNVDIDGEQWSDGRVEWLLTVTSQRRDIPLRPEDLGPLAEAILAARDEIEGFGS
jgi:hypothetical protein